MQLDRRWLGLTLLVLFLLSQNGLAEDCVSETVCQIVACRSPAVGVPAALWGALEPTDTGRLPANRDTTDYSTINNPPGLAFPHWTSLDVENGWVFTAVDQGLEVWDARTRPENPTRTIQLGEPRFLSWATDPHENTPGRSVDAPAGDDTALAFGLAGGGGVLLFDASSKTSPTNLYADRGKTALEVHAARIGGRRYAFAATLNDGLLAYDLDAALAAQATCSEQTPAETGCGVYLGRLGSRSAWSYLAGVGNRAGSRYWLAGSAGAAGYGLEVWEVSDPAQPSLALSGLASEFVHGVALWRQGSRLLLALRSDPFNLLYTRVRIYDLSCLEAGTCSTLPTPLWTANLPYDTSDYFVTASESHGIPFLYLASFNKCNVGFEIQNEWLLDVSDPASPVDVTPAPQVIASVTVGYWGWYYRASLTGFNEVAGRIGKFNGEYFYRAAYSIFDVHHLVGRTVHPLFADGFESGSTAAWSDTVQ